MNRHGLSARPDPPITAVVVSWNTREALDACLSSLREEAESGLTEVVVVDNASTDGSADMVAERHPWASLIRGDSNRGYGPAANLGAEGARSPWLLVANADVLFEPGALRRLLGAGEQDARVGIAAPHLRSPDGRSQPPYAFPAVGRTALESLGGRRLPSRRIRTWIEQGVPFDPDSSGRIDWAMGAALLIRRQAFEAVGGFDPIQWMYAEDLDLGWRISRAGWRSVYVADAAVTHAGGASSGQAFSPAEGRRLVTEAYYDWVRRRLGPRRFWLILGINLAGAWARRLLFGALGRLGSDRAAAMNERFAIKTRNDWSSAWAVRRGRGSARPPST